MKVAPILPPRGLDKRFITDYHLILPQWLNYDPYAQFYYEARGYKILDNGAAEYSTYNLKRLHSKAREVGAHEIVVPDVMGDADATIARARGASLHAEPRYKYMGVVQGRTYAEIIKCANVFRQAEYITVLGVPRNLNRLGKLTRYSFIEVVLKEFEGAFDAVHCLGSSPWSREVVCLAELPVRGIDTSLPASAGLMLTDIRNEYVHRPNGFDKVTPSPIQEEFIERNIRTYIDWAWSPSGTYDFTEASGGEV